jgi:hypothetical protein
MKVTSPFGQMLRLNKMSVLGSKGTSAQSFQMSVLQHVSDIETSGCLYGCFADRTLCLSVLVFDLVSNDLCSLSQWIIC